MANPLIGGPEPNGSDITIDAGDAQLAAYESRPAAGGSAPAVVVIHENRGLQPYLRDVADGLASNALHRGRAGPAVARRRHGEHRGHPRRSWERSRGSGTSATCRR